MGLTRSAWQIRMMSGPKITTVVTLSSSSDRTVTRVPIMTSSRNNLPRLRSAIV